MRTWKCRWPGSTRSRCASSRFVSCHSSPSCPSISRTRTRSGCPSAFSCSGLSSTSVSCTAPPPVCPGAVLHIERPVSSRKLGCSSAIEDCGRSAVLGPNQAGRGVGARRGGEGLHRRLGLLRAREQEKDLARAPKRRDAERYPVDERLEA